MIEKLFDFLPLQMNDKQRDHFLRSYYIASKKYLRTLPIYSDEFNEVVKQIRFCLDTLKTDEVKNDVFVNSLQENNFLMLLKKLEQHEKIEIDRKEFDSLPEWSENIKNHNGVEKYKYRTPANASIDNAYWFILEKEAEIWNTKFISRIRH